MCPWQAGRLCHWPASLGGDGCSRPMPALAAGAGARGGAAGGRLDDPGGRAVSALAEGSSATRRAVVATRWSGWTYVSGQRVRATGWTSPWTRSLPGGSRCRLQLRLELRGCPPAGGRSPAPDEAETQPHESQVITCVFLRGAAASGSCLPGAAWSIGRSTARRTHATALVPMSTRPQGRLGSWPPAGSLALSCTRRCGFSQVAVKQGDARTASCRVREAGHKRCHRRRRPAWSWSSMGPPEVLQADSERLAWRPATASGARHGVFDVEDGWFPAPWALEPWAALAGLLQADLQADLQAGRRRLGPPGAAWGRRGLGYPRHPSGLPCKLLVSRQMRSPCGGVEDSPPAEGPGLQAAWTSRPWSWGRRSGEAGAPLRLVGRVRAGLSGGLFRPGGT